MENFLRSTNTLANVINAVTIMVLLGMLLHSKNQMARTLEKLTDALAEQVRAERYRATNLRNHSEDD